MTHDTPDPFNLILSSLRDFRQEVNARLDRLVTQEAFQAEQRRVDERNADLAKDIADEQAARIRAFGELEKKSDRLKGWIRWLVGVALVPLALFIADRVIGGVS